MKFTDIQIESAITGCMLAVMKATGKTIEDIEAAHVGTSYIKGEGNDIDVLVFAPVEGSAGSVDIGGEWTRGGSTGNNADNRGNWESWKRHVGEIEVNLIFINDLDYFDKWKQAAEACRFMQEKCLCLTRGEIHGIHAIIMDGSDADHELSIRNYE